MSECVVAQAHLKHTALTVLDKADKPMRFVVIKGVVGHEELKIMLHSAYSTGTGELTPASTNGLYYVTDPCSHVQHFSGELRLQA